MIMMSEESFHHDDDILTFLLLQLNVLALEVEETLDCLESVLLRHIREQRRLNRSLPMEKRRVLWTHFCDGVAPTHFRRMFRMKREAFTLLCKAVCEKIGEETFKSEAYLLLYYPQSQQEDIVPKISGEVKVAVSVRMLAGGSYLDLVPLFGISTSHLYDIFGRFLQWILRTFQFPLVRWLREKNWQEIEKCANYFAEKTDGAFYGPFGANDGLAVRIRCPTMREVPDPGNYYCRKGFYALNVQALCDRSKRFLWCFPSNKGSTHDSSAFAGSRLYDLLKEMSNELYERGLFVAGDSAYGLSPFLVTPYDTDELKDDVEGARDSFNFHLSSCRIYIECAFGEVVMRWGILWRTLLFDLKKCAKIVQVCMLLHNFILSLRDVDDQRADIGYFRDFDVTMDSVQQALTNQTGEMPRAVVTDNNEPRPRGRPTMDDVDLRRHGQEVRHRLTVQLAAHDLRRPMQHDMRYNSHGHIYMTS
jgi:hypothetical protein